MRILSFSTFLAGCLLFEQAQSQDTFSKGSKGYPYPSPTPPVPSPPSRPILGQCPADGKGALGEKCILCNKDDGQNWTTDCVLRNKITCTYQDVRNGVNVTKSCFAPNQAVNELNPPPILTLTRSECANNKADYIKNATIIYEVCNFNTNSFAPRPNQEEKNFLKYDNRRTLNETTVLNLPGWDNAIPAAANGRPECRTEKITRTFNFCDDRARAMAISFDGLIDQPFPNYCRCFSREFVLTKLVDTPPAPAPVTPPVPAPVTPPVPAPVAPPVNPTCYFEDVIISELASPEQPYAKYIELFFLDKNCYGSTIPVDLKVTRYNPGSWQRSDYVINLRGETIGPDGFITICNSANAEYFYGRGECAIIGGLSSPANLRGTETIAIEGPRGIIDIFGIPGTDVDEDSPQFFKNGRVVRKTSVPYPVPYFDKDDYHVFPGECAQEVGPEGMDINKWEDVVGPICPPKTTILITEIVDLDVPSQTEVPRYVELYAPKLRHRGYGFNHNLKLVIFYGDSETPHWPSAVTIDYVPESGFLTVCNAAAYRKYLSECAITLEGVSHPANSAGNDQIALISGDADSYVVVDIYGVIGEDGYDTDHYFRDSRVIRKLHVTSTQAKWSKDDWALCKSDTPDINKWDSDECGEADGAPTTSPTMKPSPEDQKDCQFFFTELADRETPYIEIMSTCPGITIRREITVVSWKQYGTSCEVNLQGMVVPDDGFIIICRNKFQHAKALEGRFSTDWRDLSVCDVEDYQLLVGHGFNSYALVNKDSDCDKTDCVGSNCSFGCNDKYLDIYGYPHTSLESTPYKYITCRAVRNRQYPFGNSPFDFDMWEIICQSYGITPNPGEDSDPREWNDIPLVLYFKEFCDPVDNKHKRFIQLYSPNKKNFKITEDLIVMKYDGASFFPSYAFQSLKGETINEDGFLTLCINWVVMSQDTCDIQTGYNSVVNSGGDTHYALAKCPYPSNNCDCIDTYGVPGTVGSGSVHDFTDGRVFRLDSVPMPKKIFDINQWVIHKKVTADQCGKPHIPPPSPTPGPPTYPSGPSKGYSNYPSKGKRSRHRNLRK